jgi:hypothetical protein
VKKNEQRLKSYVQTAPFAFNEVNITIATNMGINAYIAAELQGPRLIRKLTIGDGQYYNGYYNAPLKPGCTYTVFVRVVTKAIDGVSPVQLSVNLLFGIHLFQKRLSER